MADAAKDPYRFFRVEARELLSSIGQCVLKLESDPSNSRWVNAVLRAAHTLKGAAGVVGLAEIRDAAHRIEDVLNPYRADAVPISREEIELLLRLVDQVEAGVPKLPTPATPAPKDLPGADGATQEPIFGGGRLASTELDELLEGIAEADLLVGALQRTQGSVARISLALGAIAEQPTAEARARLPELAEQLGTAQSQLDANVGRIQRQVAQLASEIARLQFYPLGTLVTTLERAARDATQACGNRASLQLSGQHCRVDSQVLGGLQTALLHLVRNAVAHGIETPEERMAAGKPTSGKIVLCARQQGYRVHITCTDDGRGIDALAVQRAAAQAAGARTLSASSPIECIFEPGVSTSSAATGISGRGVGLDIVKETLAQLRGSVSVRSSSAAGTTFELSVPVAHSVLSVVKMRSKGRSAYVPMDSVHQILRVRDTSISRVGAAESIVVDGRTVPFISLLAVFDTPANSNASSRTWSAVVLRSGSQWGAIGVEQVAGVRTATVRALHPDAGRLPAVMGVALAARGGLDIVLDPEELLRLAQLPRRTAKLAQKGCSRLLVVDDSLTTRMLQQAVLEGAGFEVDLACSAEEALQLAKQHAYGLFLVDVEMPGMDGFEFVRRTRADPELGAIPAVLITTRSSPEDRRRGMEAGAYAYIPKSEFNEQALCQLVRRLIGE